MTIFVFGLLVFVAVELIASGTLTQLTSAAQAQNRSSRLFDETQRMWREARQEAASNGTQFENDRRSSFHRPHARPQVQLSKLYAILGVHTGASEHEIRRAYRQLAKKLHPDVNRDPRAEEQLKRVNEAYSRIKARSKAA